MRNEAASLPELQLVCAEQVFWSCIVLLLSGTDTLAMDYNLKLAFF